MGPLQFPNRLKDTLCPCRQRLNDDAEWKTTQADLQTELSRRRTSPETSDYVMDVLKKQRAEFLDRLALQKTRIQSLLDHLNEVEVRIVL